MRSSGRRRRIGWEVDKPGPNAAEYAGLFEHAELPVQPGAGHFPWLDDPAWFTRTLAAFLG
jgi:pimeloyl-ACP methyl ester carboxylesterase